MADETDRFARFIADLALDPGKLAQYKGDAEAAMQAAGLNDEEKAVLRKGDFRIICEYLGDGARPITQDQGGPGSGPGG
ncbi:MAG TPA: hypothetical protein VEW48_12010 [Thermoanaerobaculia bacterium]|nr:hypothetical protein [Thermoanaerobaculia bacterium]